MEEIVRNTIQDYLKAYHSGDNEKVLSMLDKKETDNFASFFISFAEQMDPFGETDEFLERLDVKNLQELKELSTNKFISLILNMTRQQIRKKDLKRLIDGLEINNIDIEGDQANVKYTISTVLFGQEQKQESDFRMTKVGQEWKIHFKTGLDVALQNFQKQIDLYYQRKAKDNLNKIEENVNDLEKYTLVGFKNVKGEVVFEARFKDAGEFYEGFAYVKVMSKYGYIDKTGEIVIKPQFKKAMDFSEDLAGIQTYDGLWGFIDKKGKVVIKPKYQEVKKFNEGLCAVMEDYIWGYVDQKDNIIIPFEFEEADDFWEGTADVMRINDDDNSEYYTIDKKGKRVKEEE